VTRGIDIDFLDIVDSSPLRTGCKIVLKLFHITRGTLSYGFDGSVRAVANVTHYLMARGSALRKESITDPLHVSPD
jgi:hypothetical protein